jgi:3-hydroxymyristoyl/3-hydroxydecanoyl-(acyl carrier protein) dehydratase
MEEFLNVKVCEELLGSDRSEIIGKLEKEDMEKIIPERGRAFFVDRSVIARVDGLIRIFAVVPITFQMCEGHMPAFPLLPLGIAGWVLSQSGEILVSYLENRSCGDFLKRLSLVCKTGPVEARQKGFLVPGNVLLIIGTLKRRCLGVSEVDTEGWVGDKKSVIMSRVLYTAVTDERLWK